MPHHNSGAHQPLLHGGTHHSHYGHQHHHNHHPHNVHSNYHHHPHHGFHHGHRRRWFHPWVSFSFRPAPIVQPSLPHADIIVVERPRFRFLKVFIYTIIIWVLLGALIRGLVADRWFWGYKYDQASLDFKVASGTNATLDYPVPSGVELLSCESPLEDGGEKDVALQIQSSSDAILLFSDGPWLHGSVKITTTPVEADSVKFSVNLSSRRKRRADTIVCSLKRGDGEEGVGVFNPKEERRDASDPIRYDVTIEFPENHPLVKSFETNVINSAHSIDNLQGKIFFESLSLHGSNQGIHSESVSARRAEIMTVNGPIDGYYNASDFLKIHTVNGGIEVDIDFSQETSDKAALSLFTSNGPIKADIRLHDVAPSRPVPANFDVTAETANSPLNIAFLDAPVDSILSLKASTVVSPAEVTLHPTFEGHFWLGSTLFGPVINRRPVAEDPAGRGRRRSVSYTSFRGHIDGNVAWGEGPRESRGNVEVTSSIAKVILNL